MTTVPARFIADAPQNYQREILDFLGCKTGIFPAICAGHVAMLEVLNCKAISSPAEATDIDRIRLIYVWHEGKKSADEFARSDIAEFDRVATEYVADLYADGHDICIDQFYEAFQTAMQGFRMLPNKNGTSGEWLFAGEFLSMCVLIGGEIDAAPSQAIWEIPLTVIGHVCASKAKMNGKDGVARPKDENDIRQQLKLANERELSGELHPWQIENPYGYPATQTQKNANSEIEKILMEKHLQWKSAQK